MQYPGRIDRYKILEKIAEGAMGIVFRAEDPEIGRDVAIKVIQFYPGMDEYKQEEYRKRFKREAQAAGKLNHPNIVIIYHNGVFKGSNYIVMEYVEGTNLDERRKNSGTIPFETALHYAKQIASALDYAHSHGVVHRDVKPSNILIDRNDNLKVVDFGIAKLVDSDLTQPYQVLGSPSYMSPEQVMGTPLDGRSDIFSLGILLYYILTGRKPFEAESISAIVQRIINDMPPPPSSLNPRLTPQIDYAILKALSKEPSDRFSSAREFIEALAMEPSEEIFETPIKSTREIFERLLLKMGFNIKRFEEDNSDILIYSERQDPVVKGEYLFRFTLKAEGMKVGISVLREVIHIIQEKKLTKAVIITNTEFTEECRDFVREKPMELVDGKELEELFKKYLPTGIYELTQRLELKTPPLSDKRKAKKEEETTHDITPSDRIFFSKTQESRRLLQDKPRGIFKSILKKR